MGITGVISTFAVSTVLVAYLFYALVPVPAAIEQRDDVFWIFARQKYIRALSTVGEFFGFGHRIVVYRKLSSTFGISSSSSEPPDHSGLTVTSRTFDGIPVHVYEPENGATLAPALIWLHGGGWATGSAEKDDSLTSELSRRLGVTVVSVDYRLSPENPFPVPFDDCFRATVYFLQHAHELNIDSRRVAIAGSSSGANLAAAVSLKLRDARPDLLLSAQVLVVPCLQAFDFRTPSYQRHANSPLLPAHRMASYWLWYALGPDGHLLADALVENEHTSTAAKTSELSRRVGLGLISQKYIDATFVPAAVNVGNGSLWAELEPIFTNPYFAPLMASDVAGLPATLVMTAEQDILRDDGVMFARRLTNAEVSVEHQNYENGHHLLLFDFKHYALSQRAIDSIVQYLSKRL